MLRTFARYFPRFMTQYYVVQKVRIEDGLDAVIGVPVRSEADLDPRCPGIRVRYFNFFGKPIRVIREFRPPLTQ